MTWKETIAVGLFLALYAGDVDHGEIRTNDNAS